MKLLILAGLVALVHASPVFAREVAGKAIPDAVAISGKSLKLNGTGLRLATFLKIKAYVGALYAEKPSRNADELLASSQIRRVDLYFLRDISADKMREAWDKSFEHGCQSGCEPLKAKYETLKSWMSDVKDGDVMSFSFFPDHVEVVVKGQKKGEIAGADFVKALLATWIGAHPPNDELKEGMLAG